ncbi:MAG: efflux RND transporter periplasmic adaptor subunit [Planctomycetota bacterium]|nr:efflux RND transporter periplasmic adaptor subunit [Planctomycetota bacterium]
MRRLLTGSPTLLHHAWLQRMLCAAAILMTWAAGFAHGVEIDGFTEPYRTVNVAAGETGLVADIKVRVGDEVQEGEVIAQLDNEVHLILLETAEMRMKAEGLLKSAMAEQALRTFRLTKLEELIARGHGRAEEVERARTDVEIAAAQVLSARDDLAIKKGEYKRLQAELKRREIRAPMGGFIVSKLKEIGEYVAPNDPNLVTLVQLDPLLGKFSMKRSLAKRLHVGDKLYVRFYDDRRVEGSIHTISPIIDAESGTVRVKVLIDNSDYSYVSGERCALQIPLSDAPDVATRTP